MRKKLSLCAIVLVFLTACAGRQNPEPARVDRNVAATYRVDILTGGHGTGVVLDQSGYLLTCEHVAFLPTGEAVPLAINLAVGDQPAKAYPARVVWHDKKLDLAVLKVDFRFPAAVTLGDIRDARLLDAVYLIGFPADFGKMAGYGRIKNVRWNDPEREVEDGIAIESTDGHGMSGAGTFLVRNGLMIGLMHQMNPATSGGKPILDGRQALVRVAVPVDVIRKELDRHKIPYRARGK